MRVPFGEVSWAKDICSPWGEVWSKLVAEAGEDAQSKEQIHIKAPAWELNSLCKTTDLILDDPSRSFSQPLRFVIVGTGKSQGPGSTHLRLYGLVVTKTARETAAKGHNVYERVGVAMLDEPLILWDKSSFVARII